MGSNFHYTIDLNEDQNHQAFFSPFGSTLHHNHHLQAPNFNPSSSSSSLTSPSLSYLPFLINSHQDQVHVGYNNNTFHGFLDPLISQPLETKTFVSNGGSSSNDQMVPKKETRLKLTIRKKDNHQNQIHLPQYPTKGERETSSLKWISSKVRRMKRKTMITATDNNKQHVSDNQYSNLSNLEKDHLNKISINHYDSIVKENGYNGSNNCVIRICSDCNTTKTPLWRSGPRGPKSLCNACGIRQRKARQAAMAAATANVASYVVSPPLIKKKKMQKKNKRLDGDYCFSSPPASNVKTSEEAPREGDWESQSKSTISSSSPSPSSNKFYYDDLAIILSKSSAYQQVFPQDEKEAAILLMALSYGMVHG